jgi:signal peptidase I
MLWFTAIPALVAGILLRGFVPPVVAGNAGVVRDVAELARDNQVLVGIALFLFFAALARYWHSYLPGGRYLAVPPRAMVQASSSPPAGEVVEGAGPKVAAPARVRRLREVIVVAVGMGVAAGVALLVRSKLVESYRVLSGSMLPNLAPEDLILGYRQAYRQRAPRRGDVILFKSNAVDDGNLTDVPDVLVKRVIGLPGDRISMQRGIPVINGWTVPVCDVGEYLYIWHGGENGLDGRLLLEFLEDRAYLTVHAAGVATFDETYEVQDGELFVLGDNRNNSSDSRAWNDHKGGGVPFDAIQAKVQWFLAGRGADARWDFARTLRSIDSLATTLSLDGVNLHPLEDGIARCLAKRPANTEPPRPSAPAARADGTADDEPAHPTPPIRNAPSSH